MATRKATTAPAPSLVFADAAIPAVSRGTGAPNPYAEVVAAIAGTDAAKRFAVPAESNTDRQVRGIKRLLSSAGAACNPSVTVRSTHEVVDGGLVVTFWTIPRIEHKR